MRRKLSMESALCRSLRPMLFSFESSDRCSSSPVMTASSEALHGCHELPTLSDTHISDMRFWLTVRSKDMNPSSIISEASLPIADEASNQHAQIVGT
ncbi:hypothetical protein MUK42_25817 [Musa troglodytarum]|uniref:Uncharacterized protein n=1 Tax=Musa troglodytarum TaxID=320322 RepID=A0A9E7HLX5_9LILI|nr:hypothetical protein MUK42_25817 [Musa troglodytarum]